MAKKGKEPAGLRRYRLAQKAKKNKRATSRPKTQRKVKTMARRRSYGKKKSSGKNKFGMWKMVKGVAYTGSIIAPGYIAYTSGLTPAQTVQRYAGIGIDGKFAMDHLYQMWTPVVAVAVIDFATTKLPIQRYISRGVNNLLG